MKVIGRARFISIFLFLGSAVAQPPDATNPIPVTVCQLFEHPEHYIGKMIKVRGASVGARIWLSNAISDGSVCSAWLDVVVLFPAQVSLTSDLDVVRDESLKKLEGAINSRGMHIEATYEGRFEFLYEIRGGKRVNLTTGKQERKRVGRMSFYDARIVLHKVSDVVAFPLPRR